MSWNYPLINRSTLNRGEWEEDDEEGLRRLLYTDEGIERAMKIWEEFRQERKAQRERNGERKEKDRDGEWGYGDLGV